MLHQELPPPPHTGEDWEAQKLSIPWAHRGDSSWKLFSQSAVAILLLPQAPILPPRPTRRHLLWEVFSACPRIMAPDLILEHLVHCSLPTTLYMFFPFL